VDNEKSLKITVFYFILLLFVEKDSVSEGELVKQVKETVNLLPPAHFHVLKYLTAHLTK
jgi:hypothetical protein